MYRIDNGINTKNQNQNQKEKDNEYLIGNGNKIETDMKNENINGNQMLSTPVSTMRKAFLNKCSFMLGQGEFVNALWAWVQVRKLLFFI